MTTRKAYPPSLLGFIVLLLLNYLAIFVDAQNEQLRQPLIVDSADGELSISLTIEYADHTGPFFKFTNTRLLNGTMPGPTLRLRAGDLLRVLFLNKLTKQENTDFGSNQFTKPDYSNLHFHGAHVSGELPSDDVRLPIAPGDSYQYITQLPDDHHPGTHWVHPHVHGSSSLQVGGGAACVMIVEDPEGTLPSQVEQAEDVVLAIQDVDANILQELITVHNDKTFDFSFTGSAGDPTYFRLVNGQYQPQVSMNPGEWQRWRIVFAGWLEDLLDFSIQSTSCEMQLLAKDGIYISDYPRPLSVLPIPAGGRADVMVRCSEAGIYSVLDFAGQTVMTVHVSGNAVSSTDLEAWMPDYPAYLKDLTSTEPDPGCDCMTKMERCGRDTKTGEDLFCVNDRLFDENVYLHTVAFGSVVGRTLAGIDKHPYHQHVYPYQLVGTENVKDEKDLSYYKIGDWHDVIQMDTFRIYVRYRADVHMGVINFHCHILPHEDLGTMAQELVTDGGSCSCNAFATDPELGNEEELAPSSSNPGGSTPAEGPSSSAGGRILASLDFGVFHSSLGCWSTMWAWLLWLLL